MSIEIQGKMMYYTKEASERIGRSKDQIFRDIRYKGINDVQRDYKGYRIWTDQDIIRFKEYYLNKRRGNKK